MYSSKRLASWYKENDCSFFAQVKDDDGNNRDLQQPFSTTAPVLYFTSLHVTSTEVIQADNSFRCRTKYLSFLCKNMKCDEWWKTMDTHEVSKRVKFKLLH